MSSKTILPDGTVVSAESGTQYHTDGRTGPRDEHGRPIGGPNAAAAEEETPQIAKPTRRKHAADKHAGTDDAGGFATDPTSSEETSA